MRRKAFSALYSYAELGVRLAVFYVFAWFVCAIIMCLPYGLRSRPAVIRCFKFHHAILKRMLDVWNDDRA